MSRQCSSWGRKAARFAALVLCCCHALAQAADAPVLRGADATVGWKSDRPGVRRLITLDDLEPPFTTPPSKNPALVLPPPAGASPQVPAGFVIEEFASGFNQPRYMVTAPNGDIFLAEVAAGAIRVLRADAGATTATTVSVFAGNLRQPTGLAFYPPSAPEWLYVATPAQIVRFPYRSGDLEASGEAEVLVDTMPAGGHFSRDMAFSRDGSKLFIVVSSASDHGLTGEQQEAPADLTAWESAHGVGGYWGAETDRATVMQLNPDGTGMRVFATGLRNCNGVAVHPQTDELWCGNHEVDGLGENLNADIITRVRDGAFYGFPWYLNAKYEEPRHAGERPDLKDKVAVPDVLVMGHSSPMDLVAYTATAGSAVFPEQYRGEIFAALHGSNSRAEKTGYKIVRVLLNDGVPTGEYEDFVTGFVLDNRAVWGRPSGITVANDGALIFAEDGNSIIYRISYVGDK